MLGYMTARINLLLALAATMTLAACGGGGAASSPPVSSGSGTTQSSQSQSEQTIGAANALGDPVKTLSDYNTATSGDELASRSGSKAPDITTNTCVALSSGGSVELFVPDKNGDANSTEEQTYYDSACSQLARDLVRIYNQNGSNETVNRTVSDYAQGNATAINTHTVTVTFENATFGNYGYPVVADGFDESEQGALNISGSRTIVDGDELVMAASSASTSSYCGDSAGYNATGFASLNETFGWQGGVASGTRTVNNDGSVTWVSTHAGTEYKGAIGSMSLGVGAQNTACPVSTPQFTLNGGSTFGTYTIPVSITFKNGVLQNLSVTNAQLANGNTLTVTTNSGQAPLSSTFITGVVSNSGTQIATFSVNAYGNGTVTVTASGVQYVMNDWHVVK